LLLGWSAVCGAALDDFGERWSRRGPCRLPLVVEFGAVGHADGEVVGGEADGDQFEVISEGVVEVEGGLSGSAGAGRSGDDDALFFEPLLPASSSRSSTPTAAPSRWATAKGAPGRSSRSNCRCAPTSRDSPGPTSRRPRYKPTLGAPAPRPCTDHRPFETADRVALTIVSFPPTPGTTPTSKAPRPAAGTPTSGRRERVPGCDGGRA
jgi:hypothetical protein